MVCAIHSMGCNYPSIPCRDWSRSYDAVEWSHSIVFFIDTYYRCKPHFYTSCCKGPSDGCNPVRGLTREMNICGAGESWDQERLLLPHSSSTLPDIGLDILVWRNLGLNVMVPNFTRKSDTCKLNNSMTPVCYTCQMCTLLITARDPRYCQYSITQFIERNFVTWCGKMNVFT